MNTLTTYIDDIVVIDPDTHRVVELEVHKDNVSGSIFAIDASYVDQVSERIISPFSNNGAIITLTLGEPHENTTDTVRA